MGCIPSQPSFITSTNGSLKDYHARYLESKTLGAGEFGVVKLAHDVKDQDLAASKPLAVKYLRKGYQFKDNVLYTPVKKEILVGEVEILRKLNGECYNLKLISVYETSSLILVVTEYCEGGEMIPYVANAFNSKEGGLRTEDVSRISYQLFSAVDHCAKHGVIHRDIKPQNVMFCNSKRDSELRLIDFGSGTIDNATNSLEQDVDEHHTFAGSAFYISPEMFQRMYTTKTDVWSAAATIYVLVAGYPSERLQECFNIFQSDSPDRLKKLPNLPDNMPDSFYAMLEGALRYVPKTRSTAGQLLKGEFAQFHINHDDEQTLTPSDEEGDAVVESADDLPPRRSIARTRSILIEGAVDRHSTYLGYQSFERSLTTLLAAMLPQEQCKELVLKLRELKSVETANSDNEKGETPRTNESKLQVIPVKDLVKVIKNMSTKESDLAIFQIKSMQAFSSYENYAYHISMLRQFVSLSNGNPDDKQRQTAISGSDRYQKSPERVSVHGGNVWSTLKSTRKLAVRNTRASTRDIDDSMGSARSRDSSIRSQSAKGFKRVNSATGALSSLR